MRQRIPFTEIFEGSVSDICFRPLFGVFSISVFPVCIPYSFLKFTTGFAVCTAATNFFCTTHRD